MKELLIATTNPAKVDQIKGALSALDILVFGIEDKSLLPDVIEDGKTAVENARKKALAYSQALNRTVLSIDNSLYFSQLEGDPRQPGLHVRRLTNMGSNPTDQEMITYYSNLILSLGDNAQARWEYGVCVATPDGKFQETTFGYPTVFVAQPSQTIMKGSPLESLQKDPDTGLYRSEISKEQLATLWQKKIGEPLSRFVSSLNY